MGKRGALSDKIQDIPKKFLGVKLTQTELRLIPYLQYVMINEQKLQICKINQDERVILAKWKARGLLEGGLLRLTITKEFWNFMCEILFEGYVSID